MLAPASPASLVAPGRGAGTGAAVIFRGDNRGVLGIYQNAERLQAARLAREAAARAKADAERFKQMQTGLKVDDDTAPYYQAPYSDMVSGVKQGVGSLYNPNSGVYVADPFSRQAAVDKTLAPVRTYKRLADDDWNGYVKPTIATAKGDAELRGDDIEKALYAAHYTNNDPVNGTLIAPQDLERGYHEKVLNDPKYINAATAADNFFKKLPGSQEYATLIKGKPGTYSQGDDLMTRIVAIEPDGKGGHQVKFENGRPVLRNPLATLQATDGTRFGKLLDEDVRQQAVAREAAVEKMRNQEPLTDAERTLAMAPPKSKLDFLVDRALGHISIKSNESRQYIPLPRPRAAAGGGTGFVAPTGQLVDGTYQANLPTPDTTAEANLASVKVGGLELGATGTFVDKGKPIEGFDHLGESEQPMRADKYGNPKAEVRARGARFGTYYTDDNHGNFKEVSNNRVAQDGTYGKSYAGAIDVATNKPLFGKSKAELQAAIASGRAKPQLFVEYTADKNTSFGRQYDEQLQSMIESNQNSASPKSIAELEAKAFQMSSKGVSRQLVPYSGGSKQQIDAATNGHYNAAMRTMLANARGYRAQTPTVPKRPTGTDMGAPKLAGKRKSGIMD